MGMVLMFMRLTFDETVPVRQVISVCRLHVDFWLQVPIPRLLL